MNSCDKCDKEDYEIKPFRLIGALPVYLCPPCRRLADEYLLKIGATKEINVLAIRVDAAVHKGDGDLAADLMVKYEAEKTRLWHISKAWIEGKTV